MIFRSRLVPRVRFVLTSKNDLWSKWSEGGVISILHIKQGTRKTAFRARYDYRDLRETGPWHPKIENRNSELLSRKAQFWLPIVDFSIWVIYHFWCPWKMIFCAIKYYLEFRPLSTSDFRLRSPFDFSIRVNIVEYNNTTTFTEIPVDKLISN